ncbi:MAG: carbohydrate kinase [Clostridiales bacterium]|nr:carbohydrate kinase [Clostridiales bacterium]MDD7432873.1 carbohydrate kinase [Clostridiales bacterium]MDY3061566.1 carbohydrate kinase [Eubacteriales bacterium]
MDLACLGEMVIDFLPGAEAASFVRKAGGAPANVAISAAKCGLDVGFCGKVGADFFGDYLWSVLRKFNVRILSPQQIEEAMTTMAFVQLDEHGERSFAFARKPGADSFLTIQDVEASGLFDAQMIHAGSCSLSESPAYEATSYAMKKAHEIGRWVSFDVNYRDLMWRGNQSLARKRILEVLPYVHFLKFSSEERSFLWGNMSKDEMMQNISAIVTVETLGQKGSRAFFEGQELFAEGISSKVVDTTGAGDAFWGSFLSFFFKEIGMKKKKIEPDFIQKALRIGNIAGHLCVQTKGAQESLPNWEEIESRYIQRYA